MEKNELVYIQTLLTIQLISIHWGNMYRSEDVFFRIDALIDEPMTNETIPEMSWLSDWLDGLAWKSLHDINLVALESTAKAHNDGGCPSLMIKIKQLDAEHISDIFANNDVCMCLIGELW